MLTIEWKGLDKLEKDLRTAREKALPYAARNALNTQAFEARRIWQGVQREEFTLRNQFTQRMTLVQKASGTNIDRMYSVVGSATPFMGDQEEGAIVRGQSAHKGIPGPSAAGLPVGAHRTKAVTGANRLARLRAAKYPGASSKQRNAVAIALAVKQRNAVVALEAPGGGKKLFRITGGQRRWTGRKWRVRALKMRMLWDFTRSSVHVPGSHTLQKTLRRLEPKVASIYMAAVLEQLRRHRVLGY